MDYQNKRDKMVDWTCYCNRQFKEGEDPIYKKFKNLKKLRDDKNYRKYPKQSKIIDFNFKFGQKVAMGEKEKKPPKLTGKIKMKTYGHMDTWTKL